MAAASATPAAAGSGAISAEAAAVAGSRGNMRAMATVGPVGQASAVYASRWRCGACSAMNAPAKMKCGRCRAAKPANASTVVVKAPSAASNWTEAFDAGTQQIYYYNKATGKSQWTRPEELGPAPHATGWWVRIPHTQCPCPAPPVTAPMLQYPPQVRPRRVRESGRSAVCAAQRSVVETPRPQAKRH